MKKVSIPYEVQEQKLYMQPLTWPQRCPCCGRNQSLGTHALAHNAQYKSWSTPTTTHSSKYPLEWQIPYCQPCDAHAKLASNLLAIIFGVGLLLALVFMFVVPQVVPVLLFIAAELLIGMVLHTVLVRVVARPKMSASCRHANYAVTTSDGDNEVVFHFYDDAYADQFSELNQAESTDDFPPRPWYLRWK